MLISEKRKRTSDKNIETMGKQYHFSEIGEKEEEWK